MIFATIDRPRLRSYRGEMATQTLTEPASRPVELRDAEVLHGYPPPARSAGEIVVAYCGAPMIVRGEALPAPPLDTCPECMAIWHQLRRGGHC